MRQASPARPPRLDAVFGQDRNAAAPQESGWSGQEDGYRWSIGDSSLLSLPRLREAETFRPQMDVVPYPASPAITSQTLHVVINGEAVESVYAAPAAQ